MSAPIPCNHCGYNFMRTTLDPDAPKLCHSCKLREEIRTKEVKKMSDFKLMIDCDKETASQVEEICLKNNKNFSDYFLGLHIDFMKTQESDKSNDFDVEEKPIKKKKEKW